MAKTKWGDRERRRQDIVDAAAAALARDGLAALTMRDVATDAGVAIGTVYTYFASKEELFAVLYAERLERFLHEIGLIAGSAREPEDLFVAVATSYLDVYRVFGRELNIWSALLGATGDQRTIAAPVVDAAMRVITTLQSAIERIDGPVPDLALPLLWASITGLAEHFDGARRTLHRNTWDELVRFAARTLVAGLRTVAAQELSAEESVRWTCHHGTRPSGW
jgi:AcrR family transcriptional regulator